MAQGRRAEVRERETGSMGLVRVCRNGHSVPMGRKCKACTAVNSARYADKNRALRRDAVKRSRRRNPARCLLWSVRARANREGLSFNITEDDLQVPANCPVLGIPLTFSASGRSDNTPSVDRINPALGYVRGNVAVVSWRANRMKSRFLLSELEALVVWWRTHK